MGRVSNARERLMAAVSELFWTGSYDGTTIDQICAKAQVNKGSFYHFFDGKAALASATLDWEWEKYRPQLDAIFSPAVPPLERLLRHAEFVRQEQVELRKKHGSVLGCPLCTLGTEISTRDPVLQEKVQAILNCGERYLETAIRDAAAAGLLSVKDARGQARILHAYQMGLLMQARIQNDLSPLRDLVQSTFSLLGAKPPRTKKPSPRARVKRPAGMPG